MNDQHIIAIATVVQDALLLVSAFLVACYLYETQRLRKAAERQVDVSQKQVEASFCPAVVATGGDPPRLKNIGKGPAIDIRWSVPGSVSGVVAYLKENEDPRKLEAIKDWNLTPRPLIECEYKSLSGWRYSSCNAYKEDGTYDTSFVDHGALGRA